MRQIRIASINVPDDGLRLFKSLLALRPEEWVWVPAEQAQWWVVDGDLPLPEGAVAAAGERVVLAMVSHFAKLPSPQWTFLAKPLKSALLMKVLTHHLGETGGEPASGSEIGTVQLTRWPCVTRFEVTPALIYWCRVLTRRPVPYVQLLAAIPETTLQALLADARTHGYLRTALAEPDEALPPATASGRWQRLWRKWSGRA
ncbi:hypothetical protein [Isoalcanivorax beigongshangi]|uniref:Uncharacterized protein n=1 Tax=Isoalcanivorax beigongshangi TaxID=3238810 RepID=A0ABV4AIU8_9GAMM